MREYFVRKSGVCTKTNNRRGHQVISSDFPKEYLFTASDIQIDDTAFSPAFCVYPISDREVMISRVSVLPPDDIETRVHCEQTSLFLRDYDGVLEAIDHNHLEMLFQDPEGFVINEEKKGAVDSALSPNEVWNIWSALIKIIETKRKIAIVIENTRSKEYVHDMMGAYYSMLPAYYRNKLIALSYGLFFPTPNIVFCQDKDSDRLSAYFDVVTNKEFLNGSLAPDKNSYKQLAGIIMDEDRRVDFIKYVDSCLGKDNCKGLSSLSAYAKRFIKIEEANYGDAAIEVENIMEDSKEYLENNSLIVEDCSMSSNSAIQQVNQIYKDALYGHEEYSMLETRAYLRRAYEENGYEEVRKKLITTLRRCHKKVDILYIELLLLLFEESEEEYTKELKIYPPSSLLKGPYNYRAVFDFLSNTCSIKECRRAENIITDMVLNSIFL